MLSKREAAILVFTFGICAFIIPMSMSEFNPWVFGYLISGACITVGVRAFVENYRAKHKN